MVSTTGRPVTINGSSIGGRAAIYIRVSSHKQEDGVSLEVQLEACRRYCEKTGFDVVAEFKDVESGLHVDRAQYQQSLALARSRGFDSLVVYRYDRTGRDDAEYAGMLKDFAKLGIQLVSASGESPDPLYQKLAGVLAWDESRRLSIRVTGSKMKRHTEGKWGGKPCFGYTTDKLPEGGSVLAPKEEEAALVTEMFARYATGKASLSDLRDYLNEAGVKKSRYAIWYILTNQVYLGMVPRGRYVDSQFHETPEQVLWAEGRHQPLVDRETFDKVQVRLAGNKNRQRGGTTPRYMFSGLVYCGSCGRKYVGRHTNKGRGGKEWNWYACNRRTGFGDCDSHTIYESRIKEQVIPPIEKLLAQLSQEDVRAAVRAELVRQEEDARSADVVTKLGAKDTLERLERRLASLEDAFLDGDLPRDRYRARRDELAGQIKELRGQLAERPHLGLPDTDQLLAMADALAGEPLDNLEWRAVIEGTVERITISGRDIVVEWKPSFKPLLELTDEK